MNIKERLRYGFPVSIDKTKTEFCALVANDKGTAAIEKTLTDLYAYMTEWKNSKDVYGQTGTMLEKTVDMISFLKKYTDETDELLKNRLSSIFVRGHDTSWGTSQNIRNVFKQYFGLSSVFVVENTSEEDSNLIEDFDFNAKASMKWVLEDGAVVCSEARFSKSLGIKFLKGSCSQAIENLSAKLYYLHFFHKGKVGVKIQDGNGNFWHGAEWKPDEAVLERTGMEWKDSQIFIKLDESPDITLTFYGDEESYMDYVRLYEYKFPSFTVYIQFEGDTSKNALVLAPGKDDPVENIDYKLASYYDVDFLTGKFSGFAIDLYEDLLSYIKPAGVKGYLEIINKDYIEEKKIGE